MCWVGVSSSITLVILVLYFFRMKILVFSDLVVVGACVLGGEKISAVLAPGSELGVASVVMDFGGISLGEAGEIADWLVYNSGRSASSLGAVAKWEFSGRDTAFREVVHSARTSLCTIALNPDL